MYKKGALDIKLVDEQLANEVFRELFQIIPHRNNRPALDPWKICGNNALMEKIWTKIRPKILEGQYDAIITVSYWSLPFATILSSYIFRDTKQLCDVWCVDGEIYGLPRWYDSESRSTWSKEKQPKRALLVDDVIKTGGDLQRIHHKLKELEVIAPKFLCILDNNSYPSTREPLMECNNQGLELLALTRAWL